MIAKYERMNAVRKVQNNKKRVAAYCRVSTDNEDQANSFESQQRYFRQYIEREPEWELVEVFADEGITGTNTKKRKAFNRMIDAAKRGEIDLIITKEISRFARNTLDSVGYTRELRRYGVGVIFMNDNINTLDPDAELRLTIMSSIAQEESRKTSERVKWGQKRRMEQGVVFGRSMLGYDVHGGKMYINEEGAKIVRHIFHKFVNEGKGTWVIARELKEEGISPMYCDGWSCTVLLRILKNEKYCGDLVQKKTYTPDYLSHEKKCNRGQEEFVILRDHHEPIISREMFETAGHILDSRAESQVDKSKHSNRYCFSGKIKCGQCGRSYVARYRTRSDGSRYKAWRCLEASRNGKRHEDAAGNIEGCSSHTIRNEDALHIMYLVTQSLELQKSDIIKNLKAVIDRVLESDADGIDTLALERKITEAELKKERLIDLYTSDAIGKNEFLEQREKCERKILECRNQIESAIAQVRAIDQKEEMLEDIFAAVDEIANGAQYDDEFYRHILERMVIHDRSHVDVYLNFIPHKWSYCLAAAANAGQKGAKTEIDTNSESDMPISVSVALTRSSGMEKRCDR